MNITIIKICPMIALFPALLSCSSKKTPELAPEYIFNDPNLKVISSVINRKEGTIAVIYGNTPAVNTANDATGEHVDGEEFKMVTWKLKPMPNWYGTDMNGRMLSVETVDISKKTGENIVFKYHYEPAVKQESHVKTRDSSKRVAFIVGLPAAVMP
ncbi:hypothetical protein HNQ91_001043 [Filimonas zeae]|uniref:Uncharacterized protein n=1 Tax=Filimonas zeae TaxID=1737353 RepID=A0A917IQF9_9BACT|nr:hypothetical protein [Filimonas zeae]MDR6338021.1 hypothetical protein [Filimonas zeae]GGH61332.1 hypothetical protein GCM10011379_10200 [Filimonas zeae]